MIMLMGLAAMARVIMIVRTMMVFMVVVMAERCAIVAVFVVMTMLVVMIVKMAVLVFSVQGGLLVLARGLSWPAGNRTNAAALLILQYIGEFPFRSLLYHLTLRRCFLTCQANCPLSLSLSLDSG